jgi:hypothetical protein
MNVHHNIQHLFSLIAVGQISRYLTDRGWQGRAAEGTKRLYFERTFAGGEKPAVLWTWDSGDHPRYRNQVPNIIFMLSVLEERPALDIANDMYASTAVPLVPEVPAAVGSAAAATAAAEPAGRAAPTKMRVLLRFAEQTAVTIVEDMPAEVVTLPAHEVIELVYNAAAGHELEIETAAGVVRIIMPQTAGLRLLQGVAKPNVGPHWSAVQIVCGESRVLEDAGDSRIAAQLLEQLNPILMRIDFELDVNARIDAQQQASLLRQAAVLAAAVAHRLQPSPAAKTLVWRACAKLLYPVGLRLDLRSTSADELFDIAHEDEELSPRRTLNWLRENSISVV